MAGQELIRRRLRYKRPPPLAYGGVTVTIKAALSGEHMLTSQMPIGISIAEVTRRVAEAIDSKPEEISLMHAGSELASPLQGSAELMLLKKDAFAILMGRSFSMGVPAGSWLLVTRHDEVGVQIINLESHATLASMLRRTRQRESAGLG